MISLTSDDFFDFVGFFVLFDFFTWFFVTDDVSFVALLSFDGFRLTVVDDVPDDANDSLFISISSSVTTPPCLLLFAELSLLRVLLAGRLPLEDADVFAVLAILTVETALVVLPILLRVFLLDVGRSSKITK